MGIIEDVLATKKLEDLKVPEPAPAPSPRLTKKKVEMAIELLKEVEKNNGHIAIAQKVGLTQAQVRGIHEKMGRRVSELLSTKK
jgi:hypothetical protein